MRKITQKQLAQKAVSGTKIRRLKKQEEEEAGAEMAILQARQKSDFVTLADELERQSGELSRQSEELRKISAGAGKKSMELKIHRNHPSNLVRSIDVALVMSSGERRRHSKVTFNRDGVGNIDTIIVVPQNRT